MIENGQLKLKDPIQHTSNLNNNSQGYYGYGLKGTTKYYNTLALTRNKPFKVTEDTLECPQNYTE